MPSSLETRVTYTPLNPDGSRGDPVQLVMIGADGKPATFSQADPHGFESDTIAAIQVAKRYGVRVSRDGSSVARVAEQLGADGSVERRLWNVDLGVLTPAQVAKLHEGLLPDAAARLCVAPLTTPAEPVAVTDAQVLVEPEVARQLALAAPAREQRIKDEGRKRLEAAAKRAAVDTHKARVRVVATGHEAEVAERDNPAAPTEAVEAAATLMVTDGASRDENTVLANARAAKARNGTCAVQRKAADGTWSEGGDLVGWREDERLVELDRLYKEYRQAQRALEAGYAKLGYPDAAIAELHDAHVADAKKVNLLATRGARESAAVEDQEFVADRLAQLMEAVEVNKGFAAVSMAGGVGAAAYHDDFDPDKLMGDPVFAAQARDLNDQVVDEERERLLEAEATRNGRAGAPIPADQQAVDAALPAGTDLLAQHEGSYFSEGAPHVALRAQLFQRAWTGMYNAGFDPEVAMDDDTVFAAKARELMPGIVAAERRAYQAGPPAKTAAQAARAIPGDVLEAPDRDIGEAYVAPVVVGGHEFETPHLAVRAKVMRAAWQATHGRGVDASGQLTGYAKVRAQVAHEMSGDRSEQVARITEMEVMRVMHFDPSGRTVVTPDMMAAKAQEIADLALAAHQAGHNGAAENITYTDFDGARRTVQLDLQVGGGIIAAGPALDAVAASNAALVADIIAARDAVVPVGDEVLARACERDVAAWQAQLAGLDLSNLPANVDLPCRAADGTMQNLRIPQAQVVAICFDGNGDPDPDKLRRLWQHDDGSFPDTNAGNQPRATVTGLRSAHDDARGHHQQLELLHRRGLFHAPDLASMKSQIAAADRAAVGAVAVNYQFDIPAPPAVRVVQIAAINRADLLDSAGAVDDAKLERVWREQVCAQLEAGGRVSPDAMTLAQARAGQRFEAAVDRVAHQRFMRTAGGPDARMAAARVEAEMRDTDSAMRKAYDKEHSELWDKQLARVDDPASGEPAVGPQAGLRSLVANLREAVQADAGRFPELTANDDILQVVSDAQLDTLVKSVLVAHPELAEWDGDPHPTMTAESKAKCLDYLEAEVEATFAADLAAEKVAHMADMARNDPEVTVGGAPQKFTTLSDAQREQYWRDEGREAALTKLVDKRLTDAKSASAARELEQDLTKVDAMRDEVAAKRQALLEAQRRMAKAPGPEYAVWLQRKRELALLEKQMEGMHFDDEGVLRDAEGNDVLEQMYGAGGKKLEDRIKDMEARHEQVGQVMNELFEAEDGFSFLMFLLVSAVTLVVTKAATGNAMSMGTLMSKEGQMQWHFSKSAGDKILADAEHLVAQSIQCDDSGKRTVNLEHLNGKVSRPMLVACAAQALRGFKADQIKGLPADVMTDAQKEVMKGRREAQRAKADKAADRTRSKVVRARRTAGRVAAPGRDAEHRETAQATRPAPKTRRASVEQRGRQGASGDSVGRRHRSAGVAAREAARARAHQAGDDAPRDGVRAGRRGGSGG